MYETEKAHDLIKDLTFKDALALHIYSAFSKKWYSKQGLMIETLEYLKRNKFGDKKIDTEFLRKLSSIDFAEDTSEYRIDSISRDKVIFKSFASTNVSAYYMIAKFLDFFDLGYVYQYQDDLLSNINVDDFFEIKDNLNMFIYIGKEESIDMIFNHMDKKYISVTPYSIIGKLEDFEFQNESLNNLISSNDMLFIYDKEKSGQFADNKRFYITNKILCNRYNVLSMKDVFLFIKLMGHDAFIKTLEYYSLNMKKFMTGEFSFFAIHQIMNSTKTSNQHIMQNIILTHPWEFEYKYWEDVNFILSRGKNILESTKDITIITGEVGCKIVENDKKKLHMVLNKNIISIHLLDLLYSEVFLGTLQQLTYIIEYSQLTNKLMSMIFLKSRVEIKIGDKGKIINYDELITDINIQKSLIQFLNTAIPKKKIDNYKPNNVRQEINAIPIYDTNEENTILYKESTEIINNFNEHSKRTMTSFGGIGSKDILNTLNDKIDKLARKVSKADKEKMLLWIYRYSKYAIVSHYVASERIKILNDSKMREEEKNKGIDWFQNQRKGSLALMAGLRYTYWIVSQTHNTKNIPLDFDGIISELSVCLSLKNLSILSFKYNNKIKDEFHFKNNNIVFNWDFDSDKIVGSSTTYNILDDESNLNKMMELFKRIATSDWVPEIEDNINMGWDKKKNIAESFAYGGYLIPIVNEKQYKVFQPFFLKIWSFQLKNIMLPSIPYDKKVFNSIQKITAKSFENHVYEILSPEYQSCLVKNKKFKEGGSNREFDIFLEKQDLILNIECVSFINAKNTKEVLNRYDRIIKKQLQVEEQKKYLKEKFPNKKIVTIICSNKKTDIKGVCHYSNILKEVKKSLK